MSQESGHQHTVRCYWDCMQAGWVCRPAVDTIAVEITEAAELPAEQELAPA